MPSKTASQAARPNDQKPSRPQSGSKNAYLLAYNAVSAALWAGVLYNVVLIGGHEVGNARKASMLFGGGGSNDLVTAVQRGLGSGKVYKEMEAHTRVVQSLAGMEVLHSLFGMSPSNLSMWWC
jgi:very-long-chain (3R)-3-hydroxyacyl-CoA dehydratase